MRVQIGEVNPQHDWRPYLLMKKHLRSLYSINYKHDWLNRTLTLTTNSTKRTHSTRKSRFGRLTAGQTH